MSEKKISPKFENYNVKLGNKCDICKVNDVSYYAKRFAYDREQYMCAVCQDFNEAVLNVGQQVKVSIKNTVWYGKIYKVNEENYTIRRNKARKYAEGPKQEEWEILPKFTNQMYEIDSKYVELYNKDFYIKSK